LQHSLIVGKIISKEQVVALKVKEVVAEAMKIIYFESISKKIIVFL
jgi:hypothetical protein